MLELSSSPASSPLFPLLSAKRARGPSTFAALRCPNGSVFSIEPPLFVELEVTETEPGFKGDTATGASKPAIVETGAQVSVPLFINIGDKIKIDTRTSEYLGRA